MSDWPQWYCQVCGDAEGDNAENCDDCNDYGLSAPIHVVMGNAGVGYDTARRVVHALKKGGYLT